MNRKKTPQIRGSLTINDELKGYTNSRIKIWVEFIIFLNKMLLFSKKIIYIN